MGIFLRVLKRPPFNHVSRGILVSMVGGLFPLGDSSFAQFVSMKSFCQDIEAHFCRYNPRPCSPETSHENPRKQQCMEFLNPMLEQKEIRFRADQAKLCLSPSPTPHPACGRVFEGTLGPKASCEWSLSCRTPLVCIRGAGQHKGQCSPPLKKGLTCEPAAYTGSLYVTYVIGLTSVCAPGARCEDSGNGLHQCR